MKQQPPHYRVYAQIAVSDIHGVGVRAIRRIKKGQVIFHGDDKSHWIDMRTVGPLPKWALELYQSFAVQRNGYYGCPSSFNKLTPACYVNHSAMPNVAFSIARGFYALRNIKPDEELTADYGKFCFAKFTANQRKEGEKTMRPPQAPIPDPTPPPEE